MRRIVAGIVALAAFVGSAESGLVLAGDGRGPNTPPYSYGPSMPTYRYDNPSGWPTVVMPPQPQPAPVPRASRRSYDYPSNPVRCYDNAQACYRWSDRHGTYVWDPEQTQAFYGRGYPQRRR